MSANLRFIPLTYENVNSDASALQLILALRPEWESSKEHIEFKRFTDGITNTLLKATLRIPGVATTLADRESVLLRAYGKGTGVLIDRDRECMSHAQLAQHQLAPPLLARFENGLLYRYLEGNACSPADLRRPEIWRAIAKRLGQWHADIPVPRPPTSGLVNGLANGQYNSLSHLPEPNLWSTLRKWLDALPMDSCEQKEQRETLSQELDFLTEELGGTPGICNQRLVFSHCDLLSGNVIIEPCTADSEDAPGQGEQGMPETTRWGESKVSVSFIDYEYATPAPAAFDIANHFAEWGGFDCDYSVLPTRSQRRNFLTHYVQSYHSQLVAKPDFTALSNGDNVKSGDSYADIEQLFVEVDRFRGVPGFYWGIWALIQATISTIEFNYSAYAEVRLNEYWAWKRTAYAKASQKLPVSEIGLRESRWAEE